MEEEICHWRRAGTVLAGLWVAAQCTGCQSPAGSGESHSNVSAQGAMITAYALQGRADGRVVAKGAGQSMDPIYGENTVFVIQPVPFESLKPGDQIAYRAPNGDMIVHALMYQSPRGWVVKGYNNPDPDPYLVTRQNFIGWVEATFEPAADPPAH